MCYKNLLEQFLLTPLQLAISGILQAFVWCGHKCKTSKVKGREIDKH